MAKLLMVIALSLLLFLNRANAAVQPAAQAHRSQQPPEATPAVAPQPVDSTTFQNDRQPECDAKQPCRVEVGKMPDRNWIDYALFIASLILTVAGIAGIYVGIRTLGKIREQADEMNLQRIAMESTLLVIERQTAATEKQVKHMVNTERPFLMIEVQDGGNGSYDFYAVNHGKSPAQLVFINRKPEIMAHKFGEEYPNKPWYGMGYYDPGTTVFNEQWIKPGGDCPLGTLDKEVITLWVGNNPQLNTGGMELLAYGAIKYRGRFSEDVWESKYCYRKMIDGIRMAGPYGWNDYT